MRRKEKADIDIFYLDQYTDLTEYAGTIKRSPIRERAFGNWGSVAYSVLGTIRWSVGGKELHLTQDEVKRLRKLGELK